MNKRKLIIIISCTIVLSVAVIGTTLALMSDKTEVKENVFSTAGISGELKEPLWDNDDFTNTENQVLSGNTISENELGNKKAENFVPGREIPKDPAVANTSESSVWIAVTLGYKYNDKACDWDTLFGKKGFAEIDMNTSDWEFSDDKKIAYYRYPVEAGKKTKTLFNKIEIKKEANTKETVSEGNIICIAMGDFKIDLTAYLVQTEGVDSVKEGMQYQYPDIFK